MINNKYIKLVIYFILLINITGCTSSRLKEYINEPVRVTKNVPEALNIEAFANNDNLIFCLKSNNWIAEHRINFDDVIREYPKEYRVHTYKLRRPHILSSCGPKEEDFHKWERITSISKDINKNNLTYKMLSNIEDGVYLIPREKLILMKDVNRSFNGHHYIYFSYNETYTEHKDSTLKNFLYVLMPVTFLFDVITFPFQIAVMSGMGH